MTTNLEATVSYFSETGQDPGQYQHHKVNPGLDNIGLSRQGCGQKVLKLKCKGCQKDFYRIYYCGHRLCSRCAKENSRIVYREMKEIVDNTDLPYGMRWRLITLTIRKKDFTTAIDQAMDGIGKFYHNLLESKTIKRKGEAPLKLTRGVGAFAHLELSPQGVVHWHIFYGGKYISKNLISKEWRRITGDSYIVDIRQARGNKAIKEVCHYIVKFAYRSKCPVLWAFYYKIKDKRVLRTFGIFYNRKKSHPKLLCPFCDSSSWSFEGILSLEFARLEAGTEIDFLEDQQFKEAG